MFVTYAINGKLLHKIKKVKKSTHIKNRDCGLEKVSVHLGNILSSNFTSCTTVFSSGYWR